MFFFLYSLVFFCIFHQWVFLHFHQTAALTSEQTFLCGYTHAHKHTYTFTHTHTHAHARTHTKGYVVGSFVVYRLLVLFFIDFFLRCAFAAVWFANAAKIAIKCSFYQFHSLSLALFLLLLSLLLGEETVNSHTRRWRRLRCRGLCRLLIKRAIFLLLLLLTRRTLCYQHSPPPLLLLLLSRFAFYTFSTPTRRWHCCCCCRRRRCCSAVVSVCCCLPLLSRFGFCRVA